ncbi:MAG: LysR family transcriptional regulator [Burkholderiaceae bacterium]
MINQRTLNNITLRQLRTFLAVAGASSFTVAAEELHLTPAAVSGLIKELESQLGVKLLDRNTRAVSLSAVGKEFFPLAERVLQDLDAAIANLMNLKEMRRGIVRIAAPEVLSCTLVPQAMASFRDRYPQVQLHFYDGPVEEVLARTRRGEVDLGIVTAPVDDAELSSSLLMSDNLMLAVRRDDEFAGRREVTWHQVQRRRFVTFHRRFADWEPFRSDEGRRKAFPTDLTAVRRVNTAFAMVQSGFGVTACPVFAKDLAAGFGLALIPLGRPVVRLDYLLIMRAGHSPSPAVETFRDFLIEFARAWSRSFVAG